MTSMGLTQFWSSFEPGEAPHIHPEDREHLLGIRDGHVLFDNFEAYTRSPHFGAAATKAFHLSLLPQPFFGDLARAEVFVLLLNPGLSHSDHWAERHSKVYRQRLLASIRQDFTETEFPFLWLDPELCWTPGYRWWTSRLSGTLRRIADRHHGGDHLAATCSLSQRLAAVELVPYHSRAFAWRSTFERLPSTTEARRFVSKLVEEGSKTVIVSRAVKRWGVRPRPPLVVDAGGGRTAWFGPESAAGRAILKQYEI